LVTITKCQVPSGDACLKTQKWCCDEIPQVRSIASGGKKSFHTEKQQQMG